MVWCLAKPSQLIPAKFFLARLREFHELSVYEAITRLTHAGEAVGCNAGDLIRTLLIEE